GALGWHAAQEVPACRPVPGAHGGDGPVRPAAAQHMGRLPVRCSDGVPLARDGSADQWPGVSDLRRALHHHIVRFRLLRPPVGIILRCLAWWPHVRGYWVVPEHLAAGDCAGPAGDGSALADRRQDHRSRRSTVGDFMRQGREWLKRWAPLAVLLAAGVLVFRAWLSMELLWVWLEQWSFCG